MVDHSPGEPCSSLDSTLLGTGKFQLLKLKALIHLGGREDPMKGGLGVSIKGYIF